MNPDLIMLFLGIKPLIINYFDAVNFFIEDYFDRAPPRLRLKKGFPTGLKR